MREATKMLKMGAEMRWLAELTAHHGAQRWLRRLPPGDGHSVIVFPGFLTSERSTRPLRRLLTRLNYEVYDWGFGRNLKFSPELDEQMRDMVASRFRSSGRKVTLLGWSLGGIFAREIAREHAELVRNVISLGSPVAGPHHVQIAKPIYEFLNGRIGGLSDERVRELAVPPAVPSSVIYSRSDGIVHWHGARQQAGVQAENIAVPASHLGMGSNPVVAYVIANRLLQTADDWVPFADITHWRELFKLIRP